MLNLGKEWRSEVREKFSFTVLRRVNQNSFVENNGFAKTCIRGSRRLEITILYLTSYHLSLTFQRTECIQLAARSFPLNSAEHMIRATTGAPGVNDIHPK